MNRQFVALSAFLTFSFGAFAQEGLPPNPEPGKCYIRCVTRDVWVEKDTNIITRPGYTRYEIVPAVYETVEEKVLIKPESKRFEYVPAVFRKVTETIEVEEPYNAISIQSAEFSKTVQTVILQPSYGHYEWQNSLENCDSDDPRDCMVLCYVKYPDQTTIVPVEVIKSNTTTSSAPAGGKTITITKEVVEKEASVREIIIPAEYKSITKRKLVKDESVRSIEVPAQYRKEVARTLQTKGGMSEWVAIDCKLTSPNVLPIFYDLGSAVLTRAARQIIDEKLYQLMVEKPLIRIELSSHTDARGTSESNQDLSQRRAQTVVDYLVAKGISRDRLIAKGYGESRLVNHCKDGAECSEEEHAQNRRTEFRVLSN